MEQAIEDDGTQTVLTFDGAQDPPVKPVTIQVVADTAPAGTTLLFKGTGFLSGAKQQLAVYR